MSTKRLLAGLTLAAMASRGADAQPVAVNQDALACANPRAVRALSNPYDPRRRDPDWARFVVADGHCVTLPAGTLVTRILDQDDLSLISVGGTASQLYLRRDLVPNQAALSGLLPGPIPVPSALGWQYSRPLGGIITCEVDGQTTGGQLSLIGAADRRGILQLVLRKPTWRFVRPTPISVTMSFTDGSSFPLSGVGTDTEARFDFPSEKVRGWLHGFTAASGGSISFSPGGGPEWSLDLRGTSTAVAAMATCAAEETLELPPPFASSTSQATGAPVAPAIKDTSDLYRFILPPAQTTTTPQSYAQKNTDGIDNKYKLLILKLGICFDTHYSAKNYVSTDGGKSSLRLLSECVDEWKVASQQCQADTGDAEKDCNLKTGMLSQVYILLREYGAK